jgi:hypothetical protein
MCAAMNSLTELKQRKTFGTTRRPSSHGGQVLLPVPAIRIGIAGLLLAVVAGIGLSILKQTPAGAQTVPAQPPPVVTAQPWPPPAPAQSPSAQAPAGQTPAPQVSPDESGHRPGFVDELQKLLPPLPPISSPLETFENLNRQAKDAGENLTGLSSQKMVSGRIKCPLAANGAPDCKVAATRMCTDAGYKGGRSIDSDSAEDCPASVLLSDKAPPVQCRTEYFVLRSLCQK